MLQRLRAPGMSRALVWVSGLILIAGLVAFVTVRWGSSDPAPAVAPGPLPEDPTGFDPGPTTTTAKLSEVPKAARVTAGQFILSAVGREDLPKAWRLIHPDLRAECACSYKEWLSGNIPITPFPTAGLRGVSYSVDELQPRRIVLEVLLVPKEGTEAADLGPQAFYIGLKASGNGAKVSWLVDYWAPSTAPPVPLNPQG